MEIIKPKTEIIMEKEKAVKRIGEATPEQIEAWKREFETVFQYTLADNRVAYFRTPTLQILDACKTLSGGSAMKFNELLMNNCWLGGDDELRKHDKYKMGIFEWLPDIIIKVEGRLEKL